MTERERIAMARAFFESLWPEPPKGEHRLTLWCAENKLSEHLPLDFEHVAVRAIALADKGLSVYFGIALRQPDLPATRRGQKSELTYVPALWADIDTREPDLNVPAAPNLPTPDEGAALIDGMALKPNLVVLSGHGYQTYVLLDEPHLANTEAQYALRLYQRRQGELFKKVGFHLDVTFGLDRVFRVPGTFNRKKAPRLVEAFPAEGERHAFEDLDLTREAGRPRKKVSAALVPNSATEFDDWRLEARRRLAESLADDESTRLAGLLLAGKPFAAPGERNEKSNRVANLLVFVICAIHPAATPEEIYEFMQPSIDAMAAEDDDPENPALTEDDVLDQIRRGIEDRAEKEARKADLKARVSETIARLNRMKPEGKDGALTDEQKKVTLHRQVIQYKGSYYMFDGDEYRHPVIREEFETFARDVFADAPLVDWYYTDAKGAYRRKDMRRFMEEYGTVASGVSYDLTAKASYYDPENDMFVENSCGLRNLEPAHDDAIARWLTLLGGEHVEKLLDWIATITDLRRQTAALYLSGVPNTGKTMLAHGLARLWTSGGGPTILNRAAQRFNAAILTCPLLVADEHSDVSHAQIREMIGSSGFRVERKFMPEVGVHGCVRLILIANHDRLLEDGSREHNRHEIQASAERVLHVEPTLEAGQFIRDIGGIASGTKDWVNGDRIARHALWLRDNRKVDAPGRFLVSGSFTNVQKRLIFQDSITRWAGEWIVRFLLSGFRPVIERELVRVSKDHKLYVSTMALIEYWVQFVEARKPSGDRLSVALENLSVDDLDKSLWCIDTPLLFAWAEEGRLATAAMLDKRVRFLASGLKVI